MSLLCGIFPKYLHLHLSLQSQNRSRNPGSKLHLSTNNKRLYLLDQCHTFFFWQQQQDIQIHFYVLNCLNKIKKVSTKYSRNPVRVPENSTCFCLFMVQHNKIKMFGKGLTISNFSANRNQKQHSYNDIIFFY